MNTSVSAQIGKMGVIDLTNGNFSLSDGDFIDTNFESGWNPEIVKVIKATSLSGINLKWGY